MSLPSLQHPPGFITIIDILLQQLTSKQINYGSVGVDLWVLTMWAGPNCRLASDGGVWGHNFVLFCVVGGGVMK